MQTFINEVIVPQSDTAFLKWKVFNVELEYVTSLYPPSHDIPPEDHTISYDEGGLDPYTTYGTSTNDDSYLSSPDDSHPKVGHITGAASKKYQNTLCSIFIAIFCKYLIDCILTGLGDINFIISL